MPWLAAALILLVGAVGTGVWYYRVQGHTLREEVWKDLNGIADLKVREISEWREHWAAQGALVARLPSLASSLEGQVKGSGDGGRLAEELLGGFQATEQARTVLVLSPAGDLLRSYPSGEDGVTPQMRLLASRSLQERKVILSDFDRDPAGRIQLSVVVPILRRSVTAKPVAAVLIVVDPREYLYPLIQNWPTPSNTAETLLVRREGDRVVFLNDLRHRKGSALSFELPMTLESLPARRAVLGIEGIFSGIDYRGVPVLSVTRTVPGSHWSLVAKIDQAEAYADVWRMSRLTGLQLALLIAALALAAGLVVAEKMSRMRERRVQAERAREDLQKRAEELQLLASHLDIREEESRAISREIHEELGNSLVGARLALFDLESRVPRHHQELARSIKPILTHLETLIEHVRRISRLVRPPVLDQLGLAAAINWLAEDFSLRTRIETHVHTSLGDPERDQRRPYASAFYRICQEALSNAARHAEAKQIEIWVYESQAEAVLEVCDDGKGFDPALLDLGATRPIGLLHIRERATHLGGTLIVESAPGKGTRVRVRVPLFRNAERIDEDAGMDEQVPKR